MPSSLAAADPANHERRQRLAAPFRLNRNASGTRSARITKNATNETAGAG